MSHIEVVLCLDDRTAIIERCLQGRVLCFLGAPLLSGAPGFVLDRGCTVRRYNCGDEGDNL